MNNVEPVKTPMQRAQVRAHLEDLSSPIYADIWLIGCNVALRISDLLSITMKQVKAIEADRRELVIKESKTGKKRVITLNATAWETIQKRIESNGADFYLFQSPSNRNRREGPKPMHRSSVSRVFKEVGQKVRPRVNLSTHSMRKTLGWSLRTDANVPIIEISHLFGHSSEAVTMAYVGLDAEATRNAYMAVEIN